MLVESVFHSGGWLASRRDSRIRYYPTALRTAPRCECAVLKPDQFSSHMVGHFLTPCALTYRRAAIPWPAMMVRLRGNRSMGSMSGIVKQLKKERDRVEKQLSGLNAALAAFVGVYAGTKPTRKRRKLSAAGRARISAAQKARWAKLKRAKKRA